MNRIVFISSTYEDLIDYRRKAWEILRKVTADVRGMEEFGARQEAPLETCLAEVAQSDIYVGIIGFRLGSVDDRSGKSFTQREYERAYELQKAIRIYLMDDDAPISPRFVDREERHVRLEDFKRLLRERHTVSTFASADDLGQKLGKDLGQLLTSRPPDTRSPEDEFTKTTAVIQKFLLVPGQYSGRQIRVMFKVSGKAFPASREICSAFQLQFGRTVGIRGRIETPRGFELSGLDELFARGDNVDHLLAAPAHSLLDVYADLQFAETRIDRVEARFKTESGVFAAMMTVAPLPPHMGEYYHREADSKIALLLSGIAGPPALGGPSDD